MSLTSLRVAALLASALALPGFAASAQTAADGSEAAQCAYVKPFGDQYEASIDEFVVKPNATYDRAAIVKDPRLAETTELVAAQKLAREKLDWAALCNYRAANNVQRARGPTRVVFIGDSITEFWSHGDPTLFSDAVIDRGIGGQTSSQILLRFYSDVVALHPAVVHLTGGANDIGQNGGPISDADILNNIRMMIDIATANHIKVVLASILPLAKLPLRPNIQTTARVVTLNGQLRQLAAEKGIIFVDYFDALKDGADGFRADLSNDGVHPNRDGYAVMRPLVERALKQAAP